MLHTAVCTSMQVGKKVKKNYSWETKVFIKATQRKVFPGHQEQEQCSKLGVIQVMYNTPTALYWPPLYKGHLHCTCIPQVATVESFNCILHPAVTNF